MSHVAFPIDIYVICRLNQSFKDLHQHWFAHLKRGSRESFYELGIVQENSQRLKANQTSPVESQDDASIFSFAQQAVCLSEDVL